MTVIKKRCSKCHRSLPVSEFTVDRRTSDGIRPACKQCVRLRQRHHQVQRRAQMVAYKLTLSCVDCGWKPVTEADVWALEFDHVDPAAKDRNRRHRGAFNIGWSWTRIMAELAKCEPRCNQCHRERTHRERHHYSRASTPPAQPEPASDDWPTLFDIPTQQGELIA